MSRTRGISFFGSRNKRGAPAAPKVTGPARPALNVPARPSINSETQQIVRLARIEAKLDRLLAMEARVEEVIGLFQTAFGVAGMSTEQLNHELAQQEEELEEEQDVVDEQTAHEEASTGAVQGEE